MAVRVACGDKNRLDQAILNGLIPEETIILTTDTVEPEMLYFDKNKKLNTISEKNRFQTLTEAELWIKKYPCKGHIFTIHNGNDWVPYIVTDNNTLSPLTQSVTIDVTNIKFIDGGTPIGF